MYKSKKVLFAVFSLLFATSFAFACAKKGGNTNANSSSVEQSSSLVETPSDESSESEIESSETESSEESSEILSDSETESSEDSSVEEHICITEGEWQSDENGHWLECSCGEDVQYGVHEYGALFDGEFGKAYYCDCGAYITNEKLVDFVVEVESGKDPVVLQLADPQLATYGNRETYCYRYIREAVEKSKPDLIIVVGDIVYGRADPNGTLLTEYIEFMESLDIPWAPVFGNHDNESLMGVDWQCAQFEAAENCLFKTGDVSGNGNYTVGIEQDGELLRTFYMIDSGGCGHPMIDKDGNHTAPAPGTNIIKSVRGFDADQIAWYTDSINAIHAVDEDVKISFAYHIQQAIFEKAFQKYEEYDGVHTSDVLNNPLNLDTMENADDTDFGYLGRVMKSAWDTDYKIFNDMKALGVDSIFVGHEHCNSASIVYEGVRFQYGQKSSLYDRYNWINNADGSIEGGYNTTPFDDPITPLVGGTVIPVSQVDGSIGTGYIAYYGDPFNTEEDAAPDIAPSLADTIKVGDSAIVAGSVLSENANVEGVVAPMGFEQVSRFDSVNANWTVYMAPDSVYLAEDISGYQDVYFALKIENGQIRYGTSSSDARNYTYNNWIYFYLKQTSSAVWTVTMSSGEDKVEYAGQSGTTIREILFGGGNNHDTDGFFVLRRDINNADATVVHATEVRAVSAEAWGVVADFAPIDGATVTEEVLAPNGFATMYKKENYVQGEFADVDLPASYTEIRFAFYADKALVCRGNSLSANTVYYVTLTKDAENDWHIVISGTALNWEDGYDNNDLHNLVKAIKPAEGVTDVTMYCTEIRANV